MELRSGAMTTSDCGLTASDKKFRPTLKSAVDLRSSKAVCLWDRGTAGFCVLGGLWAYLDRPQRGQDHPRRAAFVEGVKVDAGGAAL